MQALPLQAVAAVVLLFSLAACATGPERSSAQRAAFVRQHPCPATGEPRGKCPGWVVDHIAPLCADGPDHPDNMQWQSVEEGKAKDREERQQCAAKRR